MKRLLTQTLKYVSILFVSVIVIFLGCTYIIREKASFSNKLNYNYCVFGDSHPECALNDHLIDNFRNYSKSGETYFYTYQKIKNVLKHNDKVNTVFLSFSNGYITARRDSNVWADKYLAEFYPTYSAYLDLHDNFEIIKHNFKGFPYAISLSIRKNLKRILLNDFDYHKTIGGYIPLKESHIKTILSSDNSIRNSHNLVNYNSKNYPQSVSYTYLRKIIDHCHSKNVKVILIRLPLHPKEKKLDIDKDFNDIINTHLNDVDFLDFGKYPFDDSEFSDLEHLNYKGANKFSYEFNNLLKNGILSRSNKQVIINESLSKFSEL